MLRWVMCALALGACGGEPAEDVEDLLVLELGGQNEPLSQALLRLRPARDPAPDAVDTLTGLTGERPEGVVTETPQPEPPPPEPELFSVSLRQGETLYGLARTHLGSASRWRELLELNGWTESQAARLPVGTMVKLPIR